MHSIVDIILGLVDGMWYTGIYIMMLIESSFIPFPSEVAMIPAGYLVSLERMNVFLAFFAWTFGAMTGASINYFLGNKLGRPVVKRLIHTYGKYILLSEKHYEKSEKYFKSHGAITTLVGRFIPAVRQLISIPAGIFSMPYKQFLLYTFIGAGTWNTILLTIGYIAGQNNELIQKLTGTVFLAIVIILGFIVISYIHYVQRQAKKLRKIEEKIEHNNEKVSQKKKKKHSKKK